ncbi:MAG: hypothetical protein ABR562_04845 [Thermoplasmatota archaeon]|nr:hypothetical protein [Halobacteriales archaeon]
MTLGKDALLRMHAGAMNGHDPDSIITHYHHGCRCIRDGALVAEGPTAVRKALLEEFPVSDELIGRVMDLDGEPVLVEWGGLEGREVPRGILRLEAHGDRVMEVRIDHDPKTVKRLSIRPYT